ncbi:MAG: cysteine desulfurase NifS [Deltaproteobacteria bacterium]|nr:cysteine desulfurase NifS [Deltaproteobacteria bacterium]
MRTVYLDNNATTKVADEVIDAMMPYLKEEWGNPSSMHDFGGHVKQAVEEARAAVAGLLGAKDLSEIIFTSCGSESDNTAILSALQAQPDKKHVITTRVEHPAVLAVCQYLERKGYRITYLGVDNQGLLDLDELERNITSDTALITTMWANNETGVIFPVEEIGAIARRHGVLFHTDAVQVAGKLKIDMKNTPVDMLSISGHKFHAPKGVGALYVRHGVSFRPFLRGGHQERGRRGGTEAVPNVVALGKAAELAGAHIEDEQSRVGRLRDRLEQGIVESIPHLRINGHRKIRLPSTTNISFEFVEGEAILLLLSDHGIAASSGSACSSGSLEPSHVLRAMGVPYTYAHGSIRFSLSRYNTDEDIDYTLEQLPPIIARLREISPFYKKEHPMPQDTRGMTNRQTAR